MPRSKKADLPATTRYLYVGPPHVHHPEYGFTARGRQVVDFGNCVGHLPVPPKPARNWEPSDEPATLIPAFDPHPARPVRSHGAADDLPAPEQLAWFFATDERRAYVSDGARWFRSPSWTVDERRATPLTRYDFAAVSDGRRRPAGDCREYVADSGRGYPWAAGEFTAGDVVDFAALDLPAPPDDGRWAAHPGPATLVPVREQRVAWPVRRLGPVGERPDPEQMPAQLYFASDVPAECFSDAFVWYVSPDWRAV